MIIKLTCPRESEATCELNEDDQSITIEPFFGKMSMTKCVAYLTVQGSKGNERKFSVMVSGKTGRAFMLEARSVETEFDRNKQSDKGAE